MGVDKVFIRLKDDNSAENVRFIVDKMKKIIENYPGLQSKPLDAT
jgi:hypothetical protein